MPFLSQIFFGGTKSPSTSRRFRRIVALLLLWLMLPLAMAKGGPESLVASNFRHERFPAPDVPARERVDDSYFQDAILVGDSTARGLRLSQKIPALEVLSVIGISPRTAATTKLFEHENKPVKLAEKLVALQPSMVYLWLGSNGVDTKDAPRVVQDYNHLLNVLLTALPDTPFILMELTPVKLSAQERYRNYTNKRVDLFNEGLREAASRHNVYILPINSLLKNEKNLLAGHYGAKDGIHLTNAAYEVIADFLYTHTIPVE